MTRRSSRLLIDGHPLQVLPSLARLIGLNEAIFLQQLNYWLSKKRESGDRRYFRDGRWWTHDTYEEWHEQFPFWSIDTLKRTVRSTERRGLVLSTTAYNDRRGDQTKWYAIDHEAVDALEDPDGEPDGDPEGGPGSDPDPGADESPAGTPENSGDTPRADLHEAPDQNADLHDQQGNLPPPIVQSAPPQQGNLPSPLIGSETSAETFSERAGAPAGRNARGTPGSRRDEQPALALLGIFDEALSEARRARGTSADDAVPVSRSKRREIADDADRELGAGRGPGMVERAVRRLALRIDDFPKMELAQAIIDVQRGKPWSVGQGPGIGTAGDIVRGVSGEDRRKEGYAWLFGEEPAEGNSGGEKARVEKEFFERFYDDPPPEPAEEPWEEPWQGSAFEDTVPHDGWHDLADGRTAARIRARMLDIAGSADDAGYAAAVEELRAAPWVGDGFKEAVISKAEDLRREAG